MVNLYTELQEQFEEVEPMEFYRDIFPVGSLDTKNSFTKGMYTGTACEFCSERRKNGKQVVNRYTITDDLDVLQELLQSENFVIISPISYVGKSRKTDNARVMYAFTIEIDNIKRNSEGKAVGFYDLLHQMENDILPMCNYIVASGNGIHLYYLLEQPLLLFDNVKKSLSKFKKTITRFFWNSYITDSFKQEDIQFESAFQGFRLAGGITKNGERTRIFKISDTPITVERLNDFIPDTTKEYRESKIEIAYKSELSLAEAEEKYPEWYQRRIVEKKGRSRWINKRAMYDWWLRRIRVEAKTGHRYNALMCLCVYAIKCNISREELEKDCYDLLSVFDSLSVSEENRFTVKDIADALQSFEDKDFVNYPISLIMARSGLHIDKNKRNGRKQKLHLRIARSNLSIMNEENGKILQGRPSAQKKVQRWRKKNPGGKKADCIRETGLSKKTVYKWWDNKELDGKLAVLD